MSSPLFSIIVPVYKVEEYLEQCIQSVVNQTFQDFELILVDDGSPDNSGKMCDEFAERDSRILIIHKDNRGLSSARNTGMEVMRGEYVLFLDSDDYWINSDFLKKLSKRIYAYQADVISYNYRKLFGSKLSEPYYSIKGYTHETDGIKYQITNHIWIACAWNKAIKAELIRKYKIFFVEGIISEDVDWCARLANVAESFDFLSEPIVAYRQRKGSISHSITNEQIKMLENNALEVLRILGTAEESKIILLQQYFSYQIAVFMLNVSSLKRQERNQYVDTLYQLVPYLEHGYTKKEHYLYTGCRILGIDNILEIIHLMKKCRR